MRSVIIYLPIAGGGRGEARIEPWRERLEADAVCAGTPAEATALARGAADLDVVIAAGGDGTVHDVANGLLALPEPRPALGILPLGTGNDIARNLGILTIDHAIAALEADMRRRIDLIRIAENGGAPQYCVLNCGVGLGAQVVRKTTTGVKRIFGPDLAYTVGTLRALAGWPSPTFRITHDEGQVETRVLFLGIGNGEYESGGTMRLSPGAMMDDGVLNVTVIRHGSKLDVLRNFAKISTGDHIHHHLVDYFPVTFLEVTVDPPVEVAGDGDVRCGTPVRIEVAPRALEVVAPEQTA